MENCHNKLVQESYTFKVICSNPASPTIWARFGFDQ